MNLTAFVQSLAATTFRLATVLVTVVARRYRPPEDLDTGGDPPDLPDDPLDPF